VLLATTVSKWCRRFIEHVLGGLPAGCPRRIDDPKVVSVTCKHSSASCLAATYWSARSIIPTSSVGRTWRAFGLQPHRLETFKLSSDPLFVDKVGDIVSYNAIPRIMRLVCARREVISPGTRPHATMLPMWAGQVERRSHDYAHHGTTSLIAALDIATGRVIARCYQRHRAVEFLAFW
jgi:hypothetical protein